MSEHSGRARRPLRRLRRVRRSDLPFHVDQDHHTAPTEALRWVSPEQAEAYLEEHGIDTDGASPEERRLEVWHEIEHADVEPPIEDGAVAAVESWIERNHERVVHEAERRGATLAEFVVWMLDDVIEIYQDESDSDIEEETP